MSPYERHSLATAVRDASLGMPGAGFEGTCKDFCELIAEHWRSTGRDVTAHEVFTYSPTGELVMVFYWLRRALAWQQTHRAISCKAAAGGEG